MPSPIISETEHMLEITFLGTSAAIPSRDRAMSCIAVKQGPSVTLFDCAEGSQRQLMVSKYSFMKIDAIFVTHMHGDHMFGLPGLIQTMGLSMRDRPLTVCGPAGFARSLDMLLGACEGEIGFELDVRELSAGDTVELKDATVTAFATEHGTPSLGYIYREKESRGRFDKAKAIGLGLSPGPEFSRLQNGETVKGVRPEDVIGPSRPGMSVAYTGDTVMLDSIAEVCRGVDVLIHEATYSADDSVLAEKNLHSTCVQAAETAKKACARCLIMTHISNRYDSGVTLLSQASRVFQDCHVAEDMDVFEVKSSQIRQV